MTFSDQLFSVVEKKNSPVLVGLDPRREQLPDVFHLSSETDTRRICEAFVTFCNGVIDVVAPLVPAVKPQVAFFERYGPEGMFALKTVIDYARQKELLVILDGKRNDIGSTATAYAEGILGPESAWQADALTVSPYLGDDSLEPFLDVAKKRNAGVFVLVKTSNSGGAMLQDLQVDGLPVYRYVADYVQNAAAESRRENQNKNNRYGSVGAVVGATWPQQLSELREKMPDAWFLVPGFGAQGGGAKDVLGAFDEKGFGAIINNSRGIIFAHTQKRFAGNDWQRCVELATEEMRKELEEGVRV